MTLASELWVASDEYHRAKSAVLEALEAEGVYASDISSDDYDSSVEIFGTNVNKPEAVIRALGGKGFYKAWMHAPACSPPRGDGCRCPMISLP